MQSAWDTGLRLQPEGWPRLEQQLAGRVSREQEINREGKLPAGTLAGMTSWKEVNGQWCGCVRGVVVVMVMVKRSRFIMKSTLKLPRLFFSRLFGCPDLLRHRPSAHFSPSDSLPFYVYLNS